MKDERYVLRLEPRPGQKARFWVVRSEAANGTHRHAGGDLKVWSAAKQEGLEASLPVAALLQLEDDLCDYLLWRFVLLEHGGVLFSHQSPDRIRMDSAVSVVKGAVAMVTEHVGEELREKIVLPVNTAVHETQLHPLAVWESVSNHL